MAKKSKELISGWSHTSEANKRQQLIKLMKEEAEKKEVIQQMSKEELELDLKRKNEVIAETQKLLNYETERYKEVHRGMMLSEVLKERDLALKVNKEKEKKEIILRKQQEEEYLKRAKSELEKEKNEKLKRDIFEKEWAKKREQQIIQRKQEKERLFQEDVEENQRKIEVIKNEIEKEKHLQLVEKLERETFFQTQTKDIQSKRNKLKKDQEVDNEAFDKMYTVQEMQDQRKKEHAIQHRERQQRIAARQEKAFQLRAQSLVGKRDFTDEINSKYLEEMDIKQFEENLKQQEKKKELTRQHYAYHNQASNEKKKIQEKEMKELLKEREANLNKVVDVKDEVKRRKELGKGKLLKLNNFWCHQIKELEDKRQKELDDDKMRLNVALKRYNEEDDELERYVENLILNEKQKDLNVYPILEAKKTLSLGRYTFISYLCF